MNDRDTKATTLTEGEINLEKEGNFITGGTEIRVKENESLDRALKRFKRSCAIEGIIQEATKHGPYKIPSKSPSPSTRRKVRRRFSQEEV